MSKAKYAQGPYTASKQKGKPGHCFQAQVFGPDGNSIACIEPTEDEQIATDTAKLMAASYDLLEALKEMRAWYSYIPDHRNELEQRVATAMADKAITKATM